MTTTIQMGQKARDKITGFEGIVIGFANYISGCSKIMLQPKVSEKGEFRDAIIFDSQAIEPVDDDEIVTLDNGDEPGAGPAFPAR